MGDVDVSVVPWSRRPRSYMPAVPWTRCDHQVSSIAEKKENRPQSISQSVISALELTVITLSGREQHERSYRGSHTNPP